MLDGSEVELENPWVFDGEIVGHPVDPYNQVYGVISSDTVRVPSDSVAYVEIYETPSAARWALALPLAVGGYFLLMAVIDRFTEW